jgi:enamine deaminase RidA (YjgF/YER057c/UK114 family)
MNNEARLVETLSKLGLALPAAAEPKGLYRPILAVGNFAYTAGHLPIAADGTLVTGCVGKTLDVAAAQAAARLAGLGILASLRKDLGSLDRVRRVVKVLGLVNSTADFTGQPAVLNGCSQLFADVFDPDRGVGVRSAVGVNTLPLGAAVEIEAVFEID